VPVTSKDIAYDRSSPRGGVPVVFIHAGIADRRMWDPQWDALADSWDVTRLDLRGFGGSDTPPPGLLSPVEDVVATMDEAGIERAHLVAASLGSGVAVEVALTAPHRVASLLLCPPGGSLLMTRTGDLVAFIGEENAALDAGDLDAAVEANVRAWVVGPGRTEADVDPGVVASVRQMQRQAFEIDVVFGDVEWVEMAPPALERLEQIETPTLVLVGGHDLETTKDAADRLCAGIRHVQRIDWPDAAHLPSLEHPGRFTDLLRRWLAENRSDAGR
jgi:pimeloyl-ACP methyl ester carboxylesterase